MIFAKALITIFVSVAQCYFPTGYFILSSKSFSFDFPEIKVYGTTTDSTLLLLYKITYTVKIGNQTKLQIKKCQHRDRSKKCLPVSALIIWTNQSINLLCLYNVCAWQQDVQLGDPFHVWTSSRLSHARCRGTSTETSCMAEHLVTCSWITVSIYYSSYPGWAQYTDSLLSS